MKHIERVHASFLRLEAALIHKFGVCQDSEKNYQKFFLPIRPQAKSLILLDRRECVPDEQFVAARMKSRFWRVKPQLRTKLSTKIVDSLKKAFCDDHLKNLLINHLKTFAQMKPAVLAAASGSLANSKSQICPLLLRANMAAVWVRDHQGRFA